MLSKKLTSNDQRKWVRLGFGIKISVQIRVSLFDKSF